MFNFGRSNSPMNNKVVTYYKIAYRLSCKKLNLTSLLDFLLLLLLLLLLF
jgi:hypothetical protein